MKTIAKISFGTIVIFSAGLLTSRVIFRPSHKSHSKFDEKKCEFKFLNPLRCENVLVSDKTELAPLRKKLEDYIQTKIAIGEAKNISIYYRDLHNGPIITINEDFLFSPASLLKVPIMIMYLKIAETNPEILNTKIGKDFEPRDNLNVEELSKSIQPKTEYTILELIEKMIIYSDNRSKDLLLLHIQEINPDFDLYLQTINDLGIIADPNKIDDFISVKAMSSIFRVLYNGAYLNNEMSEKALNLLSKVEFSQGLRAGVPSHIPIAHKFGDRMQDDKEIQRHDCGIVYAPNQNYLLCLMTKGWEKEKITNIIQEISKIIYTETVK